MSFANDLKAQYSEEQRKLKFEQEIAEQQRIDKMKHKATLDYIEGQIKYSLVTAAKNGELLNGVNKGFLRIDGVSFYLCNDDKIQKVKTRECKFSFFHGPEKKCFKWISDPVSDIDCSSECSPDEIVAILNHLGFKNVVCDILSHKYRYRFQGTKYKGTEEAYLYSFTY